MGTGDTMASVDEIVNDIRNEFPDFKMEAKSTSFLMKSIGLFLKILSFGTSNKFMDNYITTIGHTIYTSGGWDNMEDISKMIVLRHERVHMRQQKRMGRFLFSFVYLFLIFPAFLALGRAKLEMEAYEETIRAEIELRGTSRVWSKDYQDWLISQFTGPAYLFMWPFKKTVASWVSKAVERSVEAYVGFKPKS